ncbi:MAG: AAA family ATPase [Synechococcus sp.]|nr:AAA family ATPase [Synechococcus sp.]
MSAISPWGRAAARLLQLAPAKAAQEQALLQPLLEGLLQCQHQGAEPLALSAQALEALPPAAREGLSALPLVLVERPEGGAELWSRRQHQQHRQVLHELQQRLLNHGGLVLTGGAGTGKTTRVKQLLAPEGGRTTLLLAPTGKAAARLREALAPLAETMHCATLHRALEADANGGFRRHQRRPLEADVVVVDEVSMVDTRLMQALLAALPAGVRLILVGDPAQLPPIGGSSVLEPLLLELRQQQPQLLLGLQRSHRFNDATALGAFVQLLRQPSPSAALQRQLQEQTSGDTNLQWWDLQAGWPAPLIQRIEAQRQLLRHRASSTELSDGEALDCLDRLMVLSPRRQGRFGVEQLNARWLQLGQRPPQHWPAGTPLLVTRNDAELGLANGDRGLVRPGREGNEAVIASADGPRRLPLSLLSAVEPALALTVHKSQGSQADAVIVLLPAGSSFDRRLLYTAMTRARQRLDLLCPALDTLESPG